MQQNWDQTNAVAKSNASRGEERIGDIGMLKGVLLAWLLCGKRGISVVSSISWAASVSELSERRGRRNK